MAGIAAATTNNGIGVAGVCPNCSLLNAKVCDDSGNCPYDRIANGILWSVGCEWRDAQNNCLSPVRARSINVSLAGTFNSTTLQSAIDTAWSRGAVIACAAGNGGTTTPTYPAAYGNCIAVAATDANDARPSWSNYGSGWVDVAAPGSRDHEHAQPAGRNVLRSERLRPVERDQHGQSASRWSGWSGVVDGCEKQHAGTPENRIDGRADRGHRLGVVKGPHQCVPCGEWRPLLRAPLTDRDYF